MRRVVTAHDGDGKAVVAIDEISRDVVSFRPGATIANIWSTEGFPADNAGRAGRAQEITGTTRDNGTAFPVIQYCPGVNPPHQPTKFLRFSGVAVRAHQ